MSLLMADGTDNATVDGIADGLLLGIKIGTGVLGIELGTDDCTAMACCLETLLAECYEFIFVQMIVLLPLVNETNRAESVIPH